MSNVARVAGQAANTLSKPLDVDEVFSTYLYKGNGSTQTITNGIDLAGEGGLVAIKRRDADGNWGWYDTERGPDSHIKSNGNNAEQTTPDVEVKDFNSNGFDLGTNWNAPVNTNNAKTCSWTFRKAPKFFDVVTYTGESDHSGAYQDVPHNLGAIPGMVIVKRLDSVQNWIVWHRSIDSSGDMLRLNLTDAKTNSGGRFSSNSVSHMTDTTFRVYGELESARTGNTYVAYIFAHNDGDGDFGPDGNADIVKCGSYTGNGAFAGPVIDLEFEPQWLLIKNTSAATRAGQDSNWYIFDTMRGLISNSSSTNIAQPTLFANKSSAESTNMDANPAAYALGVSSTGFQITHDYEGINYNGDTYIYIAIRRSTAVPETATEVFDVAPRTANAPGHKSGFVTDMFFRKNSTNASSDWFISDRLRQGKYSSPNLTAAELSASNFQFDYMNGVTTDTTATSTLYAWMWKRAPNYFDVVAYTGNGTAGRTVSHNLGVAPEMIWYKNRSDTSNWIVYHKDIGTDPTTEVLELDTSDAKRTSTAFFNSTAPSASVLTLGTASHTNYNNNNYIAYLFASLDGISKVGSVTHSGTTNVDCGFSSGARFVLLKRTDATGDWYIWDSTRGIVSGNDPYLLLNTGAAEVTNTDYIDPLSSGFTITSSLTAGDYIFYAIA